MKNFVLLGLVSLLLFAVAAGLSVWLQQSKTKEVAEDKSADKAVKKGLKEDSEKPADKPKSQPTPVPPKDDTLGVAAELKDERAALKRREIRFEKEKAQQALVIEDLRGFREEVERLGKKVADEEKLAVARATPSDPPPAATPLTPPTSPPTFAQGRPMTPPKADPNEQKNTERLAVMYEAMPPETAAKLFQEMADGGKMENAVKILLNMRERQAGKVIAEVPDRTLAAQLVDRMLEYKRAPADK